MRMFRLSCRAVMPREPAKKSQRGESDHVCYHERGLSLRPTSPGVHTPLNRFVSFINNRLKLQPIALFGEGPVSLLARNNMRLNGPGFYRSCGRCWNTSLDRGSGPPEDDNTLGYDADSFTGGHLIVSVG